MKKIVMILIIYLLLSPPGFGEENYVEPTIAEYNVTVDSTALNIKNSEYPVLNYKGITYFPMTMDISSALGLDLKFSSKTGLSINKIDPIGSLNQKYLESSNKLGSNVKAQLVPFKISINGEILDNSKEKYPIILYKNITYFPMTWRFAVTEFNWKLDWSSDTGLEILIGSDTSTSINENNKELTSVEIGKLTASVVKIYVEGYNDKEWTGSGFYFKTGEIITNHHVINNAKSIRIEDNDGSIYDGEVIVTGFDEENDLATLLIDKKTNAPLQLSNSDNVMLGEKVYVIGSPLGLKNTLSSGIVSNVQDDYIQISAPISSGSSGGVLLNKFGQVIGVTTAKMTGGNNLGFAVPINALSEIKVVYDTDSKSYVDPYSEAPLAVKELSFSMINDTSCYLSWENTGADYYKLYVSSDGISFEELPAESSNENIYGWNKDKSILMYEMKPGLVEYYRVTSVKNDLESIPSNVIEVKYPDYGLSELEEDLDIKYSTLHVDDYNIDIENFEIVVYSEESLVTVKMYVNADNLTESIQASVFRGDFLIDELEKVLTDVKNNLSRHVQVMLIYEDEFEMYPDSLESNGISTDNIELNDDQTYYVYIPILFIRQDYKSSDTRFLFWFDE